jgi:hypothetical protein
VCIDAAPAAVLADPLDQEFDEERGRDMVEDLEEIGTEVEALNDLLAGNLPPTPPPDIALENAEYFFPASAWPSSEVVFGAFIASQVAQKASAILSHGCDQTVVALGFGGNTSAACMVIEGVFQTLDAVYQVMDYIGNDVVAAEVNGTYRRAKNIFDQLALTNGDVEQTKAVVQAIGEKMLILEEQQRRILELLRMPQGQRPGFPTK